MSALVILEIARLYNTSILNATASHRAFGVRAVLEAWGRPLVAYTATYFLGTNTTAVLVGYCGASVLTLLSMMRFVPSDPPVSSLAPDRRALVAQVWEYTLPLLPLGIVGWLSGMVDRYLIGVLLSPADAGLYAAMYGLGSRPLLMFGSAVELTIRPAYQQALVGAGSLVAQGYIRKWAWAIVFGSSVVIATIAITHQWLASLMLGAQYRSVSYLLPWITGGYALLLLSHITTRVCYANEATSRVFLAELTGGLSATLVGFLCIKEAGLSGAAVAVLIYNALQLLVSYLAARPWLHLTAFKP